QAANTVWQSSLQKKNWKCGQVEQGKYEPNYFWGLIQALRKRLGVAPREHVNQYSQQSLPDGYEHEGQIFA
ncbi:MAG: hypothetical protein AB8B37_07710, partial [Prochlorococcus sp.]